MPTISNIIPVEQARDSLPQLLKRAADGETIFIGDHGQPEAALSCAAKARPPKRLGLLAGKLTVPDNFDDPPPPEILTAFEGAGE